MPPFSPLFVHLFPTVSSLFLSMSLSPLLHLSLHLSEDDEVEREYGGRFLSEYTKKSLLGMNMYRITGSV
jgi:hypothetical protein